MNSRTSNLKDTANGRAAFQLCSALPLPLTFFPEILKIACHTQPWIKIWITLLVVTLESYSVLFDFGVGWESGGLAFAFSCLTKLVLIVKIGGVNLVEHSYCAFFWLWAIV